jgi:hypothetical protein
MLGLMGLIHMSFVRKGITCVHIDGAWFVFFRVLSIFSLILTHDHTSAKPRIVKGIPIFKSK